MADGGGNAKNPLVFFDAGVGRSTKDEVPLATENFRVLYAAAAANTGNNNNNNNNNNPSSLSFKGSIFHFIIPGFMCMGGDFRKSHGSVGTSTGGGSTSIYGDKFPNVEVSRRGLRIPKKHTGAYPLHLGVGVLHLPRTVPPPFLDEPEHVVFGTVVAGRNTVLKMSDVGSRSGMPNKEV
ncbi:hypothetical protein BDA96_05G015900 [Sorghum bicolor]|uniref:Peptidyl-prolyl cis-trans isomerase n=1 Tax=Sorghum bicolor TaxID=4558 RepID=A0A921QVJ6_SORBI|nr:hypothetical protein BDA96_05G015900 [Sorghum bicolor]